MIKRPERRFIFEPSPLQPLKSKNLTAYGTLDRAIRAEIAAYALVVDAKNDSAAAFYQHHGLIALPSQPMTLFLPLATASGFAT